jgi:hypothetical protein
LVIRSFNEQEETTNKRFLSLAWHTEALARTKRLPDFGRMVNGTDEDQSDEEMYAALMSWAADHNARYEQRRVLGIPEVGEG